MLGGFNALRNFFYTVNMVDSQEPASANRGDASHSSQETSIKEPLIVEPQDIDSWRTHVTETQLPMAQEHLQEEESWEEQQARLKPTIIQPGNKILRPAVDDAPFDQGFRFEQAKAFGGPPSKVSQSNGQTTQAAKTPTPDPNVLNQKSRTSSNADERPGQPKINKSNRASSVAPTTESQKAEPTSLGFEMPAYEGSLKSRGKYFDLTGPFKSTITDKSEAIEPSSKDGRLDGTAGSTESTEMPDGEPKTTTGYRSPKNTATDIRLEGDVHVDEASNATSDPNVSTRTAPLPLTRPIPRGDNEMKSLPQDLLHERVDSIKNKVTKRRSKPHVGDTHSSLHKGEANQPRQENVPNSEQLLKMFLFRRRKEEEEQHLNRNELQQKGVQLRSMAENVSSLRVSLQQAHRQCETQDAELSTYRQRLVKVKDRATNFQKFVDGLSRDHEKLQGDFRQIKTHFQDILSAKLELESTIAGERGHYQAILNEKQKKLRDARAEIAELEVQSLRQEQDLINHNDLIDAEQQRNDMLEHEVSMISAKQLQMSTDMAANQVSLMEKLATFPDTKVLNRALVPSVSPESILAKLQEIFQMLNVSQNKPSAFLEEFQRFSREIKANAELLTSSIRNQQHEQKSFQTSHSTAVERIGLQMEALCGGLQKERELSQVVTDLRQAKASLEECTERKIAEIATLNSKCFDLERQNQRKHTDVEVLNEQIATLRARPEIDPTLPERLRESECMKQEMQDTIVRLQDSIDNQQRQIQDRESRTNSLQRQLEETKLKLDNSEAFVATLQSEKEVLKKESRSSLDNLRAEFVKAAEIERSVLAKKHAEALYTMQNSRDNVEKRCAAMDEEVRSLKRTSTSSKLEVTDLKAQLQEAKSRTVGLETQLQVLRENYEANDTKSTELCSRLENAQSSNADLKKEVESLKQKLVKARSASANVSELHNTLNKIGEEKREAEQQITLLKAALTQSESQNKAASNYHNGCVQTACQVTTASEPRNAEQATEIALNGANERLPPTRADLSPLNRTLGSLVSQNSGPGLSEELPYSGKKYARTSQDMVVKESQQLEYEQPLDALYEDIDLLMASDAVQQVPSRLGFDQDRRANDAVVNRTDDGTIAEPRRSGASPPPSSRHSEEEGETHSSHANRISTSSSRQKENVALLHHNQFLLPTTPTQSPSRTQGHDFERRSNFSAKRAPQNPSQDLHTISKANKAHEEGTVRASGARGEEFRIRPMTIDKPSTQSARETVSSKRKRLSGEADREMDVNSKAKINKFTKTTKDISQSSVESPTKRSSLSRQEAARRGKPRVSRGEILSLGPIIGGLQSPSKTTNGGRDGGNKKKTRKGSDKFRDKFNALVPQ